MLASQAPHVIRAWLAEATPKKRENSCHVCHSKKFYTKRPHSTWSRMRISICVARQREKRRNQRLHSTAMPAITIFIPFIMALSVPYRTIDSGDIIYSPKELRYRGASNGPVQFVGRARECEQTGQLLLQFLLCGYAVDSLVPRLLPCSYAVDTSVLQYTHTHTGSQKCFYAELMTSLTEDSNGTFSNEAKIFRYDSSRSKEYFTVNLDTNTVEMTQVSLRNCTHVHVNCQYSYVSS